MKNNKIVVLLSTIIILLLLIVLLLVSGKSNVSFGKSYEEQLATTWYVDYNNMEGAICVLNEDGTGYIYGYMGRWEVVDGDELKLTDYSGRIINFFRENSNMKIVSLKDGRLVLANNDGSIKLTLYDEPVS